jgi:allantoate deiminase
MQLSERVIERCRLIARCSDEPEFTTRTFLSPATRDVHALVKAWMEQAGMTVRIDAAGNVRGTRASRDPGARRVILGSHLDTVPRAGAFDGILGVAMAIALVEMLDPAPAFHIEIAGFSEEEGVRFGTPFLGSLALTGGLDDDLLQRRDAAGTSVAQAIRHFGLDPARLPEAKLSGDAVAYFEFHIEQGPVLDRLGIPLGVVQGIAGQSRLTVAFEGAANHAGTTPMNLRRDALAGAAEWILAVEREAAACAGLTATVGQIEVRPGAGNVIAGSASATLDVRHAEDAVRREAAARLVACATQVASRRGLSMSHHQRSAHDTVLMSEPLNRMLEDAVRDSGCAMHRMFSGAGHDAMILAPHIPSTMLFLRSPGGISHHPDETVRSEDVAAALVAGRRFLEILGERGV